MFIAEVGKLMTNRAIIVKTFNG